MTTLLDKPSPSARPTTDADLLVSPHPVSRPGRPWRRIIVDSVLLATFIFSFASLALGNILWHVAAGSAFAVIAVVHFSLSMAWIRGVARRRHTIKGRTRTNAVIASVLAVGWIAIVISGIGLSVGVGSFEPVHSVGTILLAVFTVVHLMLHRRWIKRAALGQSATDRTRSTRAIAG